MLSVISSPTYAFKKLPNTDIIITPRAIVRLTFRAVCRAVLVLPSLCCACGTVVFARKNRSARAGSCSAWCDTHSSRCTRRCHSRRAFSAAGGRSRNVRSSVRRSSAAVAKCGSARPGSLSLARTFSASKDISVDRGNCTGKRSNVWTVGGERYTHLSVHEQHVIALESVGKVRFDRVSVPYMNASGRSRLFSL